MRLIKLTFIFTILSLLITTANADNRTEISTISDISAWKHPVHEVLAKHNVGLAKVELHDNKRFPVFFVKFPYDPQSSAASGYFHKLYLDVLEANGFWEYAFNDEIDGLLITIHWDKKSKKMTIDHEEISAPGNTDLNTR
jgi:hypothetical protein